MKWFRSLRYFGKEFLATIKTKSIVIPMLGLLVVPILYSGVYLVANWDPYSNVKNMPVAVVNEDKPVTFEGQEIAIGRELVENLHDNDSVQFHFVTKDEAERGLKENLYYLMIEIPEEMSQHATTILDPNPTPLELVYKENSSFNFLSGQISDKVVEKIKSEMSQKVTETYVEQMFSAIGQLAVGLDAASEGAGQLEDGLAQLGAGIDTFRSEINHQINEKTSGAGSLVDRLLEENKKKIDDTISKEIDQAINTHKAPLLDKLNEEIDAKSNEYSQVMREKVHTRIDEIVGENSDPANEKLHQEIDRAFDEYGVVVRQKLHQDLDAAYATHYDEALKAIEKQVDQSVLQSKPVAQAMMHNLIDQEMGKLDETLHKKIHEWIDTKVDELFDPIIKIVTDNQSKIASDLEKLGQDLEQFNKELTPEQQEKLASIREQVDAMMPDAKLALDPEQLIKLRDKMKQDLKKIADEELNAANKKLLKTVHAEADKRFESYFPMVRGIAQNLAKQKAEEMAPVLLAKAHMIADEVYRDKSKEVQNTAHTVLDEKWSSLQPEVVSKVHEQADQQIDRVQPEIVNQLHETANSKVEDLTPIVREKMHSLADMKLDEASKKLQHMIFTKMTELMEQVDKATATINGGFDQLKEGQQMLIDGGAELRDKLKEGAEKATQNPTDDTYQMVSKPVGSEKIDNHDVSTYGVGMAPYFLSLGFFVGALMFSIIFPMKETKLPAPNGFAWFLSKYGTMIIESMLQVLIACSVVLYVIGLTVTNVPMFFLVSIVTSLMFFAFIQFFVTAFGNVGRFIIIILLVLQLSATAGTFPIELTPEFFQMLHPFLPMTYTIRAYRGVVSLGDMSYVWQNISILLVFTIIPLICSMIYFTISDKIVKRKEANQEEKLTLS
ncbi:YhgE/Pip domain-containing protein [Paenibacillus aquistagni]|uniref:YhgE/Pip N-terminal domain-containing protein/YhgE/Pip C-terminal domain-containing protein n=1 Tax=Paenibacillus aquistagni TaxID=1852522 RepID=A0A1X7LLX8_9BACL|nr:YhgE/Pip domain-containing protein [Paenibacillus aquistagni]SMG54242.1 YhgE/Pip N-terminal domain-containing protein/YhgE/Pip C-terminal domain-containing protein [Paenibacillus aquistagni]